MIHSFFEREKVMTRSCPLDNLKRARKIKVNERMKLFKPKIQSPFLSQEEVQDHGLLLFLPGEIQSKYE
jgi:hypothetical protein